MNALITVMILAGSALMVYNIWGFIRFSKYVQGIDYWGSNNAILYFPIALLVMFLIGYLIVGLFGKPDIIMAGILFGGSIFVFVMYRMLMSVTTNLVESEALKKRLSEAQESERIKNTFLATMSHEMRTPLNVILGLDDLALKNPDLPGETRGYLKKIGLSAKHLLTLINNMLDMKRLESGMLQVKNEEFSLGDALDQVCAITEARCEEKGIAFISEIYSDMRCRVVGDIALLEQVLLTILDNAVKYTDAGGTVRFTAENDPEKSGFMRFITEDNGVGIDAAFLPKLFESFSQEDSSSTSRYGGSGLSLAVAKRMTDAMGAEILVKSEKNKGSEFTVVIPLEKVDSAAASKEEEEVSLEGKRVLVVEDIPENAEIVMDLLELEGVECEHAENGRIALECFESHPQGYYDAIFMDLRMPVMDG
ncbi:MAG: response regulator, partial [Solobacterium sp.]|nr:response regulator [Solobacterium sp.]